MASLCIFLDENENENQPTENLVKRDYSENRNLYRDDEQVSLCVERYDDRLVQLVKVPMK